MRARTAVLVVVLCLAACGDDPSGDEGQEPSGDEGTAAQPTIDASVDTFPEAMADGELRVEGGCVVLDGPDGGFLVVWPGETRLVGDPAREVVLPGGDTLALGGASGSYTGGAIPYSPGEPFAGGINADLDACSEDLGIEDVWLMAATQAT